MPTEQRGIQTDPTYSLAGGWPQPRTQSKGEGWNSTQTTSSRGS